MTGRELIQQLLNPEIDLDAEIIIRVEAYDYTILDVLDNWRGHPTLLALEGGK